MVIKNGMHAFLNMACISSEAPAFVKIAYRIGTAAGKPILIIGYGMTFNIGELCNKDPALLQLSFGFWIISLD